MRKLLIAACAAIVLSGCAGAGPAMKIPVVMPGGERATIVTHNQTAPDWMVDRDKLALNYVVNGDVTDKQIAAVDAAEKACRVATDAARPSDWTSVLSQGALYAIAGYIGIGVGSKAFTGAVTNQYARYGAWATGTAGIANGIVTRGGQTYTFEVCGRDVFDLFPNYQVRVLLKSPY